MADTIKSATENLALDNKGEELSRLLSAAFEGGKDEFQGFIGLTQKLGLKQAELDIMSKDTIVAAILSDYLSDVLMPNSSGDLISIISKNINQQQVLESIYKRLNLPLDKIVHSLLKNAIVIAEFEQSSVVSLAKRAANEGQEGDTSATETTYVRKPGTILPSISIINDTHTVFPIMKYERCVGYVEVRAEANMSSDFDWQSEIINYTDVIIHESMDYAHEIYGVRHDSKPLKLRIKQEDGQLREYDVASGCSMLEDSYAAWKTVCLLQDSVVLASLIKNAQIMLVETESGSATPAQIEAAKLKLRSLFEGQLAMGSNGIKSYLSPQAKPAYIYSFPNNGVGKISAQIIGGVYDPGQLYYMTPFINQFYAGMNYPKQNAGFTDGAGGLDGGGAVEQYNKRYKSTVSRVKRLVASFIKKCINNVLLSKNLYNLVDNFEVKIYGEYEEEGNSEVQLQLSKLSLFESIITFSGLEDPKRQKQLRSILIKQIITSKEVTEEIDRLLMEEEEEKEEKKTEEDLLEMGEDTQLPEELSEELGLSDIVENEEELEVEDTTNEVVDSELPEMGEILENNGEDSE